MKRIVIGAGVALIALLWTASAPAGQPANSIQILSPGPVRSHQVYDVTVRGFARRPAIAYLVVDYGGCAARYSQQLRRAGGQDDSYPVAGAFADVSGWKSSSAGTDHACAYLVTRAGRQLAASRLNFHVGLRHYPRTSADARISSRDDPRHRPGNHRHHLPGLRRDGRAGRSGLPRVQPALPAARLGRT